MLFLNLKSIYYNNINHSHKSLSLINNYILIIWKKSSPINKNNY